MSMKNEETLNREVVTQVQHIMSKEVDTFKKNTPLIEATKVMGSKSISCVVVIDDKNLPIGILTERDMIKKVCAKKYDINTLKIQDVMTSPVICISPEMDILKVGNYMVEKKVRRFPVVKDEELVGLVTVTDLLHGTIKYIKHMNWRLVEGEITLKEYKRILKDVKMLVNI